MQPILKMRIQLTLIPLSQILRLISKVIWTPLVILKVITWVYSDIWPSNRINVTSIPSNIHTPLLARVTNDNSSLTKKNLQIEANLSALKSYVNFTQHWLKLGPWKYWLLKRPLQLTCILHVYQSKLKIFGLFLRLRFTYLL